MTSSAWVSILAHLSRLSLSYLQSGTNITKNSHFSSKALSLAITHSLTPHLRLWHKKLDITQNDKNLFISQTHFSPKPSTSYKEPLKPPLVYSYQPASKNFPACNFKYSIHYKQTQNLIIPRKMLDLQNNYQLS